MSDLPNLPVSGTTSASDSGSNVTPIRPGSTLYQQPANTISQEHPGIPTDHRNFSAVEDKDVRRLEDRIDAVNREGQLRLDAVMAKIDGKLDGLSAVVGTIRDQTRDIKNLVIGSVFVILFGVLGILIGLKQVWVMGVQVGQTIPHASDMAPPPAVTRPP
jgi:hypothetical protein